MELLITSLVALCAGMAAYQLYPLPGNFWRKALDETMSNEMSSPLLPFWRTLLAAFGPLVKYTPVGWMKTIENQLYWAQLAGKWPGWELTEVVALHIALGGVGVILGGLVGDVTLIAGAAATFPLILNLAYLRAPARRLQRQLGAELPEFVSMLAAEVGADVSLPEAVVRLSRGPGVCAAWFRRVLSLRGVGGLFSIGTVEGALREEAIRTSDSDLIGLATSLDNVKERGTGAQELLAQIAASTASRYIGEAQGRAEKIGSELILPALFFFFFPFIIVLIMVMASPTFGGPR